MKRPNFAFAPLSAALAAAFALLTVPALAGDCSVGHTPTSDFAINGDGTVTHTKTGLTWDRCVQGLTGTDCAGGTPNNHTWASALSIVTTANSGNHRGYADWRLPNVAELRSLMDECRASPAINTTVFNRAQLAAGFWSSTPRRAWPGHSWYVVLSTGQSGWDGQSATHQVLLVRGGDPLHAFDVRKVYAPVGLTNFTTVTSAAKNVQLVASDTKTLAGLTTITGIKIAGAGSPQYQVNGGAWTSQPGLVKVGDKIKVRLTSANADNTAQVATLTVGGVAAQFSVTTAAAAPAKPTGVTARAGNGSATVTWVDPSDPSIASYTVTANPGGATCTVNAPATSCTVPGLANGTAYAFTVTATNSFGAGTVSDPSNKTPISTVPTEPTGVSATPGNGKATVNWTAPANNGGSAITGYVVTAYPGGATCTPTPATATTCDFTGLENDKAYTFTVAASNDSGTSYGSASDPITPVTPASTAPDKPTGVTATAGSGQAGVSWIAPANDGGAAITSYTVTASPGGKTCTAVAPATSCVVTGLTGGQAYTFSVTANNDKGTSVASDASAGVTPTATAPATPGAVTATPGDGQATISWAAPADGGSAITGYTVTAQPGGATCTAVPPATTCTIPGLTNGTEYSFSVVATNGAGDSASSSASTLVAGAPGKPSAVTAAAGDGQATVSWTAPADNGSAITGYTVTASPGGATCSAVPPATSCTVTGLPNGTAYTFTATATNSRGTGPDSAASGAVTPSVPAAPSGGDSAPPVTTTTTLPSGGGTAAPSSGQTVVVTDNGSNGSTINLPSPTGGGTDNVVKIELPHDTGTVTATSNSENTKLGVQTTTLPGSTTPVTLVTVDQGSSTLTATRSGQAVAGLKNGIIVVSGTSNSKVTVDTSGGAPQIGVASSDTIIVPKGTQNVSGTVVDLPAPATGGNATPVTVKAGDQTLSVQANRPGAKITLKVVDIGGVQTPVVAVTGTAQVGSGEDAQPLVSVGGSVITSGSSSATRKCNTLVEVSSETAKEIVQVNTCYIVLPAGTFSALGQGNGFAAIKDGIVWAGETAEFDKNGQVIGAYLGTKSGTSSAVGDDTVPGGNKFSADGYKSSAFVPRLAGTPLRLNGAKLDESVFSVVDKTLGVAVVPATPAQSAQGVLNFQVSGDASAEQKAQAALTFNLMSDQVSVIPTRRIRVDTSRADGVSVSGEGNVEVASGGLVTIFAPSVGDPQVFAAQVAQALPGATSELRWNGTWQVTSADGSAYVGRPVWNRQANAATFAGATFAGVAGNVAYHDGAYRQMIVPDFADYTSLQATFAKELGDAKLTVLPRMDGTAIATVNGQSYTLLPHWNLVKADAAKPAWWLDNGVLYIKNADGTAQGFTVR
ncbi:MAG: fibronectin type III domain-containing protein [Sulfuricella sp.]|nr:fibronectin type III domain-containing protein [Sulfuricella sp.]